VEGPSTGLSCNGRGDLVGPRLGDIKTTKCTTPKEFNNDCYKVSFIFQTAHYFEGFTNVGVKFQDVPFICGIQKDRDKREPDISSWRLMRLSLQEDLSGV
jgi:hypothetical protein